jgi:hypothetical protein
VDEQPALLASLRLTLPAGWRAGRALLLPCPRWGCVLVGLFALTPQSADTQEGRNAFREKRVPRFTGP